MADIIFNNYLLFANFHRFHDAWKLARTFPILELFKLQIKRKLLLLLSVKTSADNWTDSRKLGMSKSRRGLVQIQGMCQKPNWSIRPNSEGRIMGKREGWNIYEMAEQLDNGKAEFDHKAEW